MVVDFMKVCGVIAEYDPFHKGHAWQLKQAKEESKADYLVCVMSMSFTQRGMPALLCPHDRAEMALKNGADIVLGVPYAFSVCDAEKFALGGVEILRRTGIVNCLSFGIEADGKNIFSAAAELLEAPTDAYLDKLHRGLESGISYPRAQGEALSETLGTDPAVFSLPNTSLAICYARACAQTNAQFDCFPIERKGNYHDNSQTDNCESYDSASAVRAAFHSGNFAAVRRAMPESAYEVLMKAMNEKRIQNSEVLLPLLRWRLRNDTFDLLPDLSEGIENRFTAAADAWTRDEMVLRIKSKRYTYARINRLLAHILTQTNKNEITPLPEYAYLLGFKNNATHLLREIDKNDFPLYHRLPSGNLSSMMQLDKRADDLWALGASMPFGTLYRAKPVILNET